jgi:mannose-6-phosphate isomerase-like protein (cupin superfamily)
MREMGEARRTYEGTNGARLVLVKTAAETNGESAVLERLMKPHTGKADPHLHQDFHQSFEVLEGTGRCAIDRDERDVGAGETAEIPPGTRHVDIWNGSDEDLHVRTTIRPAPAFADVYVRTLGTLMEEGKLNDQDEMKTLQVFALLSETRAKSYDARVPIPLQNVLVPVVGRLARALGYRTYA